jgi:hypothetical protein
MPWHMNHGSRRWDCLLDNSLQELSVGGDQKFNMTNKARNTF